MSVIPGPATGSLALLLQQTQEATTVVLKRLEDRLQKFSVEPSDSVDPTAQRWTLELAGTQARTELRGIHQQAVRTVSTMQSRDAISDGEAAPIRQALERLLDESLHTVEESLRRTVRKGSIRSQSKLPQGRTSPRGRKDGTAGEFPSQ
jgi:hypothetical protein